MWLTNFDMRVFLNTQNHMTIIELELSRTLRGARSNMLQFYIWKFYCHCFRKWKKKKTQKCTFFFFLFVPVIQCPSLNTPDHAIQSGYGCSGLSSHYSTSCFFSCMLGYETVGGSQKRTCLETRQWSGTQLQCQGNGNVKVRKAAPSYLEVTPSFGIVAMISYN